jgi:hypothetical protein
MLGVIASRLFVTLILLLLTERSSSLRLHRCKSRCLFLCQPPLRASLLSNAARFRPGPTWLSSAACSKFPKRYIQAQSNYSTPTLFTLLFSWPLRPSTLASCEPSAPRWTQRAHRHRPTSFLSACVAPQLHQPHCFIVNNTSTLQVESIKKRAQALKVAKQVCRRRMLRVVGAEYAVTCIQ